MINYQFVRSLVCALRVSFDGESIPKYLDRAMKSVLDENPSRYENIRKNIRFSDVRTGFLCIELPNIFQIACLADLVEPCKGDYNSWRFKISRERGVEFLGEDVNATEILEFSQRTIEYFVSHK